MSTQPLQSNAALLDLSYRMINSTTVVASPTNATETVVCQLTIPGGLEVTSGVWLFGWASLSVGTAGDQVQLALYQTDTSGTQVAFGQDTVVASDAYTGVVAGVDGSPVGAQKYVLTVTVDLASTGSTVAGVFLGAIIV